jgi:signal transduction histidine kinase
MAVSRAIPLIVESPPIPRAWPVLAALAAVAALVAAFLLVDLVVASRVGRRTEEIVEGSQRSVELVDDLRAQAHRLAHSGNTPDETRRILSYIAADARDYDPLANGSNEREEWLRLQKMLAQLQSAVATGAPPGELVLDVGRSIDRIVAMNRQQAHDSAEQIRRLHQKAVLADASVGLVTLLLVSLIVVVLLRVLRRQRQLTARHIALLDERNRELDAFAGRAAHDLRGPLNPIRGYADLLMAGHEPPDEVRQMASRIRIAVDRMSRVVDDMLELSRAARPGQGEASLSQVAAEVIDELGADLVGVAVDNQLTDSRVACAPGVLASIVRNLVGNAIKFRSRQRKPEVHLTSRAENGAVELVVEDNGVGMDEEAAAHAFEPYWRGRTDREVPGHGLGLAIVERATRAIGGSLLLTSAPDRGTRISVRLPRA